MFTKKEKVPQENLPQAPLYCIIKIRASAHIKVRAARHHCIVDTDTVDLMRIDSFLCAECCRDTCRLTRCTDGRNDTNRRLDKEVTADTASRNKQVVNISDNDRAERDFKVRLFVFNAFDMLVGKRIAKAVNVHGIVGLRDRIIELRNAKK